MRSRFDDRMKMPLFFKLWFAFVAALALCVFGSVFTVLYTVATDPAIIGRSAGKIIQGFIRKAGLMSVRAPEIKQRR